jgi:endoglucanase
VPDNQTDPEGKICKECFNDFGLDLSLTEQWQEFTIPFTSMKQIKTWGSKFPGINPAQLYGMQFQVNEPNATFDVWVDDIAFTGCGG